MTHRAGDPSEGNVLPPGAEPNSPTGPTQDPDAGAGAAPYSLIEEPEPVTAADPDYLFRGVVRKAKFLQARTRTTNKSCSIRGTVAF